MKTQKLAEKLKIIKTNDERVALLRGHAGVQEFLRKTPLFNSYLEEASADRAVIVLELLAIGEGEIVFSGAHLPEHIDQVVESLFAAEAFFFDEGGLVAYYEIVIELLFHPEPSEVGVTFDCPPGIEILLETERVREAIREGIVQMPLTCEIWPVGGAGDRLNLVDEGTGEPLPAAELPFLGHTLLEGLVRDLEGRERLYEKLFHKKIYTPVALMTSLEKDNHREMRKILEKNKWFGRPQESFFFFVQPLVPVLTIEGHFSMRAPLTVNFKPGGHGVIWKLMRDSGAFDWLKKLGRTKGLVRQINNPIAGIDFALLALSGIGHKTNKAFGFLSCQRRVHASEGMDVLVRREVKEGVSLGISNVEYTDFKRHGIQDRPERGGSLYSKFPANTNLLFIDLKKVKMASERMPLPGKLLNFKSKVPFIEPDGTVRECLGGRLETTMQNIADAMADTFSKEPEGELLFHLETFLVSNQRIKTIGVTKRPFRKGGGLEETPEGAFLQIQENMHRLLQEVCGVEVPELILGEEYLERGPGMIFLFHPALGPLWSVIGQKIRGGRFYFGAEMQLEIAEVDFEEVSLQGSLLVKGDLSTSRVVMRGVKIKNRGIDPKGRHTFWKNRIEREEALWLYLEEESEFIADGVVMTGAHKLRVPRGHRMTAERDEGVEGGVRFRLERLRDEERRLAWEYAFDEEGRVKLRRG